MTVHAKHDDWWCECGERLDDNEVCPKGERAPSYAGHQAHPCPVCLNVHGGEGLTVEALAEALMALDYRLVEWWNLDHTSYSLVQVVSRSEAAALTERSAT